MDPSAGGAAQDLFSVTLGDFSALYKCPVGKS
jgi:hypothetical protein